METTLPNDYLASDSPPVGGHLRPSRKDWLKEKCSSSVLNIITHGYILPFIVKLKLASHPDLLRIQGPPDRPSSGLLYPLSPDQELNWKGRKSKVSWLLQSPVSSYIKDGGQS